ncbi:hypothetical protein F53441_10746 [Fusarium austroafricanum]|uniref:Uncharacterized protein n=1 Tax=Fusarium austroafricanum TaxID=2364996 RepID=A0A8H4K8T0_9HYPO|nr:hypothetical protein F53441_10746 [Fusarium austroafricanum]
MSTSLIWNNQDGSLAVNRDNLRDFYNQSLQNYIPSVCFQVEAHCEQDGMMNCTMSAAFTPGGQPILSEVTGETVLSYSYNSHSHDGAGINDTIGSLTIDTTYNMDIQFTNANGGTSVVITQHLVISYDMRRFSTTSSGNVVDKTIVDTYTLTVDESGILSAGLDSQTTDNSSADSFQNFFTDSHDFIREIQSQGDAFVSTGEQNIPLSNKSAYSFPGGQTLAFKNVQFSGNQDLLASVA